VAAPARHLPTSRICCGGQTAGQVCFCPPRERAQRFLREQLARGPKQASVVEEAAAKAHIDEQALGQARADLGIVASRAGAGGVQAVQWSLPA